METDINLVYMFPFKKVFTTKGSESDPLVGEKRYQSLSERISTIGASKHPEVSQRAAMMAQILNFLKDHKNLPELRELPDKFENLVECYIDSEKELTFLSKSRERFESNLNLINKTRKKVWLKGTAKATSKKGLRISENGEVAIEKTLNQARHELKEMYRKLDEMRKARDVKSAARKEGS